MGKIPDLSIFTAKPGGRWPPQHVNIEVDGANYLVVSCTKVNFIIIMNISKVCDSHPSYTTS